MYPSRKRRILVNTIVLVVGLVLFGFLIRQAWSSLKVPQQPQVAAVNSSKKTSVDSSEKPVAQILLADEVHKILSRREKNVTVLDIQERKRFKEGHLPSAINIPTDEMEARAEDELSKSNMIIIVDCACDGTNTASLLMNTYLTNLGFSKVAVLDEGLNAWRAHSFELVVEK